MVSEAQLTWPPVVQPEDLAGASRGLGSRPPAPRGTRSPHESLSLRRLVMTGNGEDGGSFPGLLSLTAMEVRRRGPQPGSAAPGSGGHRPRSHVRALARDRGPVPWSCCGPDWQGDLE